MTCKCTWGERVPYDEFLPYILPAVGEVPDAIAAHAARVAAIEYATITHEIKATILVDSQRGVPHYRLKADDAYTVAAIDYVDVEGCEYTPNRQTHGFGHRFNYTFDRPEERLILNPPPSCTTVYGIEVRAAVLPNQDSCYIDKSIYERHAELIANGAMMRLYRMKDASWYDPSLAREMERLWRDGLRWARVHSLKGGSTAPLVMQTKRSF